MQVDKDQWNVNLGGVIRRKTRAGQWYSVRHLRWPRRVDGPHILRFLKSIPETKLSNSFLLNFHLKFTLAKFMFCLPMEMAWTLATRVLFKRFIWDEIVCWKQTGHQRVLQGPVPQGHLSFCIQYCPQSIQGFAEATASSSALIIDFGAFDLPNQDLLALHLNISTPGQCVRPKLEATQEHAPTIYLCISIVQGDQQQKVHIPSLGLLWTSLAKRTAEYHISSWITTIIKQSSKAEIPSNRESATNKEWNRTKKHVATSTPSCYFPIPEQFHHEYQRETPQVSCHE